MNVADKFVVYDNIQFSKKGWFHRNRLLINGKDKLITLPLKKDSDYLDVKDRYLAELKEEEFIKILRIIKQNYSKAPYFKEIFPLVEDIFNYGNSNLFLFIEHSIVIIKGQLGIETEIIRSSNIPIDHNNLKGKDKVIAIIKETGASEYINTIGGEALYNKADFINNGIKLKFIESNNIEYKQLKNEFIPWLSIIDIMMFNSIQEIKEFLKMYKLK